MTIRDIMRKVLCDRGVSEDQTAEILDEQRRPGGVYYVPGEAWESFTQTQKVETVKEALENMFDPMAGLGAFTQGFYDGLRDAKAQQKAQEGGMRHTNKKDCPFCFGNAFQNDPAYVPCWVKAQAVETEIVQAINEASLLGCESTEEVPKCKEKLEPHPPPGKTAR